MNRTASAPRARAAFFAHVFQGAVAVANAVSEATRRRKRWGVTIMELEEGDAVASVTVVPAEDDVEAADTAAVDSE